MIFTAILTALISTVTVIFNALPFNIPNMPIPIITGLDFINNQIGSVVHLLAYAYTPPFFLALVVIGTGILTFDYVYGFWLWTIRKIPFIAVK